MIDVLIMTCTRAIGQSYVDGLKHHLSHEQNMSLVFKLSNKYRLFKLYFSSNHMDLRAESKLAPTQRRLSLAGRKHRISSCICKNQIYVDSQRQWTVTILGGNDAVSYRYGFADSPLGDDAVSKISYRWEWIDEFVLGKAKLQSIRTLPP